MTKPLERFPPSGRFTPQTSFLEEGLERALSQTFACLVLDVVESLVYLVHGCVEFREEAGAESVGGTFWDG